jgi:uncharacterized membrane protein YfcA
MELLAQHSGLWLLGLAAALAVTGLVAGVMAGLLGVGGGIVIVPVLYHLFTLLGIDESVRMHVTVGTSLATIIPTSILSSRAHRRKGSLDMNLIRSLMPGVVVGVALGSIASRFLDGSVLTAVALLVALNMAFKRDGFALADGLPGRAGTALLGGGIGGVSTLMGIGGGTLSVPLLNALKVPMHTAVGTGAMLGMVISIPGALAFVVNGLDVPMRPPFSLGYVNLLGFALIVPATLVTTGWGATLAHRIDARRLRQVFAAFLALTSLRMFYGLLT